MTTKSSNASKALAQSQVATPAIGSRNRPHTLAITGHQRVLPVPFAPGTRVRVESNAGDTWCPLEVEPDGVLRLPCAADPGATRVYVRALAGDADRRAA